MTESSPEVNPERRVILVSDSLPYKFTRVHDEPSNTAHHASPPRPRSRAEGPLAMLCDSLDAICVNEPVDHGSVEFLKEFKLQERHNHAARWVGAHLKNEQVIYVGKTAGIDIKEYEKSPQLQAEIKKRYWNDVQSLPVMVSEADHVGHWEGYCRKCVWPLLHNVLWENDLEEWSKKEPWRCYSRVNEVFCEAIMSVWRPGDIVWVLDYQLLLLPGLLRARADQMIIGLYIRSPFPSSELFRCLPGKALVTLAPINTRMFCSRSQRHPHGDAGRKHYRLPNLLLRTPLYQQLHEDPGLGEHAARSGLDFS